MEKASKNFPLELLWTDKRFRYLKISVQIVAFVSLICSMLEIIFGLWSLDILTLMVDNKLMEVASTKSKHSAIGFVLFLTLSARITALIVWIRSTRNEYLRCYSVTSHTIFVSIFVVLGLGGLLIYFLSAAAVELSTGTFKPHTEILLAFSFVSVFDILFSTFGFAVASDLQCKIRREWECDISSPTENWVLPSSQIPKWRKAAPVHEVYV